jgi:hypothetical protein
MKRLGLITARLAEALYWAQRDADRSGELERELDKTAAALKESERLRWEIINDPEPPKP